MGLRLCAGHSNSSAPTSADRVSMERGNRGTWIMFAPLSSSERETNVTASKIHPVQLRFFFLLYGNTPRRDGQVSINVWPFNAFVIPRFV